MEFQSEIKGLYIHFPFCRTRCPYCDFFSVPLNKAYPIKELLKNELALYRETGELTGVQNIYFGGGTPSLADLSFFADIIGGFASPEEITVEVNPEDADRDLLNGLKASGVNRISLGVQTLNDDALTRMGRHYSGKRALRTLEQAGLIFGNVSADRLIGFPGDSETLLETDYQAFLNAGPVHISAYQLTLNGTQKKYFDFDPDNEHTAELYFLTCEILEKNGFRHYEISNFAKHGYEAKYNSALWRGEDYIGIGPGAWGTVRSRRYSNHCSLIRYEKSITAGRLPISSEEILAPETIMFEKFMLGLRTDDGIDAGIFTPLLNLNAAQAAVSEGLAFVSDGRVRLTCKGMSVYNEMVCYLSGPSE